MTYLMILHTALQICIQGFLFGDRPTQCRNLIDIAAKSYSESPAFGHHMLSKDRAAEDLLWRKFGKDLIQTDCGPFKKAAPTLYADCAVQDANYMLSLRARFEQRAKEQYKPRSVK